MIIKVTLRHTKVHKVSSFKLLKLRLFIKTLLFRKNNCRGEIFKINAAYLF